MAVRPRAYFAEGPLGRADGAQAQHAARPRARTGAHRSAGAKRRRAPRSLAAGLPRREQAHEDPEQDRPRGLAVATAGERGDPLADDRALAGADAHRALERQDRVGGGVRALDGEEVVEAVERSGELVVVSRHGRRVARRDAVLTDHGAGAPGTGRTGGQAARVRAARGDDRDPTGRKDAAFNGYGHPP